MSMDATILKQLLPFLPVGRHTLLIYIFWLGLMAFLTLTAYFAHQKHHSNASAQNLHDIKLISKHSHSLYWGGIAFIVLIVESLKCIY